MDRAPASITVAAALVAAFGIVVAASLLAALPVISVLVLVLALAIAWGVWRGNRGARVVVFILLAIALAALGTSPGLASMGRAGLWAVVALLVSVPQPSRLWFRSA